LVSDIVSDYQSFLEQLDLDENTSEIEVDYFKLTLAVPSVESIIYDDPEEVLEDLLSAYWQAVYVGDKDPLDADIPDIDDRNIPEIRIVNCNDFLIDIRDIRSKHLQKFVSIEGMVRKTSEIRSEVTVAVFRCKACGEVMEIKQAFGDLIKPKKCKNCGGIKWIEEMKNRHVYEDVQRITVQENPEGLKSGEQPKSIDAKLIGGLVGQVKPGENIFVNGIITPLPVKKDSNMFYFFLETNSIEHEDCDYTTVEITESDIEEIKKLSKSDDLYDTMIQSFAPGIYGLYDLKLGILLSLFGGVSLSDEYGIMRGDIHLLLVGDAGIAKSKLMKSIKSICPRFVYASGKSSSAVGLTATVNRDPFDGKWVLEAGAAVLASGGVLIIDEFDKMTSEDRSAMHEVLEEQSITITKASISSTLSTKVSVVAAMNPKEGRFDDYSSLSEQIGLPPSLLSRFDLVFMVQDIPNQDKDTEIAQHILSRKRSAITGKYPPELIMKYIAYSKTIIPKHNEAVDKMMVDCYVDTRKESGNGRVTITPRQLEGISRLSEAFARMRLSNDISEEDVRNATGVYTRCINATCMDDTGETDIDKLCNDKTAKKRSLVKTVLSIIPDDSTIKLQDILSQVDVDRNTVLNTLDQIAREGEIYEPRLSEYRKVKR